MNQEQAKKEAKKYCKENGITDRYKIKQVTDGLVSDVDITLYGKDCFSSSQMVEIRFALENGINFKQYANPEFSFEQMREIRRALEEKYPAAEWAKPDVDIEIMKQCVDSIMDYKSLISAQENLRRAQRRVSERKSTHAKNTKFLNEHGYVCLKGALS